MRLWHIASGLLAYFMSTALAGQNLREQTSLNKEEPEHLSLPNLLKIDSMERLKLNWEIDPSLKLDNGRIIFGKGEGGIWSKPKLMNTNDEWTIELVFKSTGTSESNAASGSNNGLALWLIDESEDAIKRNRDNFGGPRRFDGFQFLLNTKESKGLKIFNNDKSKDLNPILINSVGECRFNYLDSTDPFSLRFSYSKLRRLFKIQLENALCFKTEKIKIPDDANDYKFGITSSLDPGSGDTFELYKLDVWSHMTEDALDDHSIIKDGKALRFQTNNAPAEQKTNYVPPSEIRESIMERNRKLAESSQRQLNEKENLGIEQTPMTAKESEYAGSMARLDILSSRITELGSKLEGLGGSPQTGLYKSGTGNLEQQILDLKLIQEEQSKNLAFLQENFKLLESTLKQQHEILLQKLTTSLAEVIEEVREDQLLSENSFKKINSLMQNNKDVQWQVSEGDRHFAILPILRWTLVAIIAVVMTLIVVVHRLRRDIKHSKIL